MLAINSDAVTIKQVELQIVDHAWREGWVVPQPPPVKTGKKVAVVGSGPSGLAAAQQLTRVGHDVTVFERADRIGGLRRYAFPSSRWRSSVWTVAREMEAEGTVFRPNTNVGTDVTVEQLKTEFDAVVLAGGATAARDLPAPGREFTGIYQAMEYLPWANRVQQGDLDEPPITAAGKHVVIVGGGDTGADCLGTAHRQGAASVTQLEIMPTPPEKRTENMPWPTYPMVYRVASAHEEGGERRYAVNTVEFTGDADGNVATQRLVEVTRDANGRFVAVEGTEHEIPAYWCSSRWASSARRRGPLLEGLGVDLDPRGNVARDENFMTSVPGVFTAGDMGRGQSLIVWAISEGRAAAAGVDEYLTGRTVLPRPIAPTDRPLVA